MTDQERRARRAEIYAELAKIRAEETAERARRENLKLKGCSEVTS